MSPLAGPLFVVASCALVTIMGVAAWTDYRARRIPNVVSFSGLAIALGFRAWQGWPLLGDGLLGAGLALLLSLLFFALGVWGGGDAKLLVVSGAFLGSGRLAGALLLIALLGGVLALLAATLRGQLTAVLRGSIRILGGHRPSRPATSDAAWAVPYGIPIAVGTVIWWFFGGTLT